MRVIEIYQPHTTNTTLQGLKVARNSMRLKLWNDTDFAHKWLCHPDRDCFDGCDGGVIPERFALYKTELED